MSGLDNNNNNKKGGGRTICPGHGGLGLLHAVVMKNEDGAVCELILTLSMEQAAINSVGVSVYRTNSALSWQETASAKVQFEL